MNVLAINNSKLEIVSYVDRETNQAKVYYDHWIVQLGISTEEGK